MAGDLVRSELASGPEDDSGTVRRETGAGGVSTELDERTLREHGPGAPDDLSDLLEEVRILQQGAQMLTAFLILLPFSAGFAKIGLVERWIYLATFLSAVASLVFLSAPAAQHRLERPLLDRSRFKDVATRTVIAGVVFLSFALGLATLLVISEVLGGLAGQIAAVSVAGCIAVLWWIVPIRRQLRHRRRAP